jgi:hypothetical protein
VRFSCLTIDCSPAANTQTNSPRFDQDCTCGITTIIRDSPDESQTGINVRVSSALLQDRREVLTATSTSGNPNACSPTRHKLGEKPMSVLPKMDQRGTA